MKVKLVTILLLGVNAISLAQNKKQLPIIDMHLHAMLANDQGPPPVTIGAPFKNFGAFDPKGNYPAYFMGIAKAANGNTNTVTSPTTDGALQKLTLAAIKRRNIYAVTSGDINVVRKWHTAEPNRIINAIAWSFSDIKRQGLTVDSLEKLFKAGEFKVFGEIGIQYEGASPADPRLEPYLDMAEKLDIPVGIHVGPGPPGAPYLGFNKYRAGLHSALLLDDVLTKHPKLRLYVMHAGWPMADDMIAMLYTHPQLYVDLGVIDYVLPKKEFYHYLERLVDAGFGKRILYGSDNMVWPASIDVSVNNIETAPFLSFTQKRDILFYNAARFLRLTDTQLAKMK